MSHSFVNQEDWLRARGQAHDVTLVCGHCTTGKPYIGPASTFAHCDDHEGDRAYVCVRCIRKLELAFGQPEPAPDTWAADCERANDVRAERNRRLDQSIWTVLPGSPLSPSCQAAWAEYRLALNSITVRFASPSVVQWPETPETIYADV